MRLAAPTNRIISSPLFPNSSVGQPGSPLNGASMFARSDSHIFFPSAPNQDHRTEERLGSVGPDPRHYLFQHGASARGRPGARQHRDQVRPSAVAQSFRSASRVRPEPAPKGLRIPQKVNPSKILTFVGGLAEALPCCFGKDTTVPLAKKNLYFTHTLPQPINEKNSYSG